jgi:hypothetical protein
MGARRAAKAEATEERPGRLAKSAAVPVCNQYASIDSASNPLAWHDINFRIGEARSAWKKVETIRGVSCRTT